MNEWQANASDPVPSTVKTSVSQTLAANRWIRGTPTLLGVDVVGRLAQRDIEIRNGWHEHRNDPESVCGTDCKADTE